MGANHFNYGVAKAALSWLFQKFYKNHDKNRDEDGRLITAIETKIEELCRLGSEYWAKDQDSNDRQLNKIQRNIVLQFSVLSRLVNKLRLHGINCEQHFLRFKQCITGGQFESNTRKANHAIVNVEIPKHAGAFTAVVQAEYCKTYRRN